MAYGRVQLAELLWLSREIMRFVARSGRGTIREGVYAPYHTGRVPASHST
jgi:hypothetical protein